MQDALNLNVLQDINNMSFKMLQSMLKTGKLLLTDQICEGWFYICCLHVCKNVLFIL